MTRQLRILELGSYLAPAYAGMILAEQGHRVTKWCSPTRPDPVLGLLQGAALWDWLNLGKTMQLRHSREIATVRRDEYDVVIDNHRAAAWEKWGVDPSHEAGILGVTWVSLRDDFGGRSFDVIAQARAWGDMGILPFYLGDTAAGLWLAFKALAAPPGHHVLKQATALAKLVEGEAVLTPNRSEDYPYDPPGTYSVSPTGEARVRYRGQAVTEPARDVEWRRRHLPNRGGRFLV